MSIGSRIKERREELGITQVQLAEQLGVTKGAIGNYESGANSPKASILYKVFDVLKCDANYIFQDETALNGTMQTSSLSPDAMQIAVAYEKADKRSQRIVKFVLDDFMKTSVPAMATRRIERTAEESRPITDTERIMDAHWQENLSQWLKEHPNANVNSGDVPEWVEFNVMRAVYEDGLPGWTKEELRERAELMFEHPQTGRPNIVFPSDQPNVRSETKSGRTFSERQPVQGAAKSGGGKTKNSSCDLCSFADSCPLRSEKEPLTELRNARFLYDAGGNLPLILMSKDECPFYVPRLFDENGNARFVSGRMNPTFQGDLSETAKSSKDNGDDSEKA